jgi:anti-sigma-K factor RskA
MSDHDALRELAAPYALGLAGEAERRVFEAHLASCAECQEEVAEIHRISEGIGQLAPQANPPADLRRRIIDAAQQEAVANVARAGVPARSTAPWWLAAAASIAALVAGGQWWVTANRLAEAQAELSSTRQLLADAESRRASAERAVSDQASHLAVLAAPDAFGVSLAGQPASPQATGRVVWSATRGLVFTAANLPALPSGRVYQLWAIASGPPVGVALVSPAATGQADVVASIPNAVAPTTFALTIEPAGGSPGPTGAMYLLGTR